MLAQDCWKVCCTSEDTIGCSWPRAGDTAGPSSTVRAVAGRGEVGLSCSWWSLQEMPQVASSTAALSVAATGLSAVSVSPQLSFSPRLSLCLGNPPQLWLWGPECTKLLIDQWGSLWAVDEWLELEHIEALLVPAVVDAEAVAEVGAGCG